MSKSPSDLSKKYDFFLFMQNRICGHCKEIFGERLGQNLENKWAHCQANVLNFVGYLDTDNRNKLFTYMWERYGKK